MLKRVPTDIKDRSESYIASTVRIVGKFICNGVLRIDGTLEGSVEGEGHLIVGRSGHIKGDVNMRSVTNLGTIEGNLNCTELIELLEGSKLLGDVSIQTSKFRIEDNVTFSGKSNTNMGSKKK